MLNVPANKSKIVFQTVPVGSYAKPGEVYLVTLYGKPGRRQTVDLCSVETGASTQDVAMRYESASFTTI